MYVSKYVGIYIYITHTHIFLFYKKGLKKDSCFFKMNPATTNI